MTKFIKENKFVAIIALIFVIMIGYYINESNKDVLKGKKVDGKAIVYSIADEDVNADDFYDDLYKVGQQSSIIPLFRKEVASQAIETTDELKEEAAAQASMIEQQFASQYPGTYKDVLNTQMAAMGYTSKTALQDWALNNLKERDITEAYIKAHFDELNIRNISYLLVKAEDPTAEPTEAEKEKMNNVDKAIADGTDFAEIAKEYSDDPSSAPNGGVLGLVDKNTSNLDPDFLKAALSLDEGQVSDWVHSTNFGWFRIKNNASTPESIEAFAKDHAVEGQTPVSPYLQIMDSYVNKALYTKAEELGIDFHGNSELEEQIKKAFGMVEEPKEEVKEEPKEEVKEETAEDSKEEAAEDVKEETTEDSKEETVEESKDDSKEEVKDETKAETEETATKE